ncbi:hypothetical protein FNB79_00070 [Formosa sediminum]|uniref:Uncharacterized protein n=1 Tax=Formosa sediminum TaxID=2594004 RepID=A0A516GLQ8_9FLAO|nr:DUF6095 family protein [Formosa sediminum]QDO92452.1 hypothetical protein FNB79_00070 [Formosa sediminum]
METNKTEKEILVVGLKKMGISLACMFLGPTLLHIALTNREKPLFIPILILGGIVCICAIFFAYKGLMKIMDSMFNHKK